MQKVGGHPGQGTSTREQSHKGGTFHGMLHKSEEGSVCTGGLMREAGGDKLGEDILNLESWARFRLYPAGQGRLLRTEVI